MANGNYTICEPNVAQSFSTCMPCTRR